MRLGWWTEWVEKGKGKWDEIEWSEEEKDEEKEE